MRLLPPQLGQLALAILLGITGALFGLALGETLTQPVYRVSAEVSVLPAGKDTFDSPESARAVNETTLQIAQSVTNSATISDQVSRELGTSARALRTVGAVRDKNTNRVLIETTSTDADVALRAARVIVRTMRTNARTVEISTLQRLQDAATAAAARLVTAQESRAPARELEVLQTQAQVSSSRYTRLLASGTTFIQVIPTQAPRVVNDPRRQLRWGFSLAGFALGLVCFAGGRLLSSTRP